MSRTSSNHPKTAEISRPAASPDSASHGQRPEISPSERSREPGQPPAIGGNRPAQIGPG